jgi:hypothetical protein
VLRNLFLDRRYQGAIDALPFVRFRAENAALDPSPCD